MAALCSVSGALARLYMDYLRAGFNQPVFYVQKVIPDHSVIVSRQLHFGFNLPLGQYNQNPKRAQSVARRCWICFFPFSGIFPKTGEIPVGLAITAFRVPRCLPHAKP